MAELWIEELKMYAQKARVSEEPNVMSVDPEQLLKLIERATASPPVDALTQCQSREEALQEEVEELERENFDLRYENEHLAMRLDELEEKVDAGS